MPDDPTPDSSVIAAPPIDTDTTIESGRPTHANTTAPSRDAGDSGDVRDTDVADVADVAEEPSEASGPTGWVDRLDAYQRRHTWLGFPIGVFYKYFDDRGFHLAAIITYYGFVSLFPLLLLFVSILGFFVSGSPELQQSLLNSALRDFPIVGPQLRENVHGFTGSGGAIAVGIFGVLYGGTGVMQAAQAAFNRIYAVPRNEQPNPFKSRIRSLLLLLVLGGAVLFTSAIAVVINNAHRILGGLGPWVTVSGRVLTLLLDIAIFTAAFRLLVARRLEIRRVLLGGAIAGIAWNVLQTEGTVYLASQLQHSRELYGTFGLVLATIAWIYIQATVVIFSAEINVTLHYRLWPRSLLTPFTDNVQLTPADKRAYAGYAFSERHKGFETVETRFDRDDMAAAHAAVPAHLATDKAGAADENTNDNDGAAGRPREPARPSGVELSEGTAGRQP